MTTVLIIIAAAALLSMFFAVGSFVSFKLMTLNVRKKSKASKKRALDADILFGDKISAGIQYIKSTPCEDWYIKAFDSLTLHARFFKNGDADKTIILFHGFRSSGEHDFSCAFKMYFDFGFNILIPDQRAHGKSEGKYICYGVLERFDAVKWIEKLNLEIGDEKAVFLSGVSMGASTVLMASGLDLPKNVKGIIADCGFTSPEAIITKVMEKDMHIPKFPLLYGAKWVAKHLAKCDLGYSSIDALKSCKLPLLFIHGKADNFVPFYMGEENYAACPTEKSAVWVESAGHGTSFLYETERCVKALKEFIDKNI